MNVKGLEGKTQNIDDATMIGSRTLPHNSIQGLAQVFFILGFTDATQSLRDIFSALLD